MALASCLESVINLDNIIIRGSKLPVQNFRKMTLLRLLTPSLLVRLEIKRLYLYFQTGQNFDIHKQK